MIHLVERLSYDELFRMSEPRRVARSYTVKTPPLDIDSFENSVYYVFNFKGNPSTTGLRHRGYIKFIKPRHNRPVPLSELDCEVDCTCQDYRYRWAYQNWKRKAGQIGPNSMNQCIKRAPRITNPSGASGLCKHILAARKFIYGMLSSFPSKYPDTSDKLKKLVTFGQKRWANIGPEMQKARERDKRIQADLAKRRAGVMPKLPNPPETPENESPKNECVVTMNMSAKTKNEVGQFLSEAQTLINQLAKSRKLTEADADLDVAMPKPEEEEVIGPETDQDTAPDTIPEPPDDLGGASEEDNEALNLLREIRDLLQQLSSQEAQELEAEIPGEEEEPNLDIPEEELGTPEEEELEQASMPAK